LFAFSVQKFLSQRAGIAIYEKDLQRLWPANEKDRETKIAQFAKKYGFRLRFYSKGLYALFDKWPSLANDSATMSSTNPARAKIVAAAARLPTA
jgi:hypothetical protein